MQQVIDDTEDAIDEMPDVNGELVNYQTRNLGLAAYLLTYDARLSGVKTSNNRISSGEFVFRGEKEVIDKLVLDYSRSKERTFDDNMRYLKSLCVQGGSRG